MLCNASRAGKQFAQDRECLYQRWRRLLKAIIGFNRGVSPLAAIEDTDRDLDNIEAAQGDGWYPKT